MKIEVFAECPKDNQFWLKATYTFDELTELSKGEIASKEGSTTPKVSISFELNRSNILMLSKIEVKIDELTMVEKKKESLSLNLAKTAKVTKVSADEDKSSESEQKDQTDSEKTTDELSKEETAETCVQWFLIFSACFFFFQKDKYKTSKKNSFFSSI